MIDTRDLTWGLSDDNLMILEVKVRSTKQTIMRIFLGEAMESAGREAVMAPAGSVHRCRSWLPCVCRGSCAHAVPA